MKGGDKVKRRAILSLVLAMALVMSLSVPAFAANPTVSITVTAEVIAITNTQANWAIGNVATTATVYFSTDGTQDDNWAQILNTGSVAVDIEIQGADIVATNTTFNWVLAADGVAGDQIYGLWANSPSNGATYNVTVKSATYVDIMVDLAADGTYDWSMKFLGPTAFHASDDGIEKSTTVTLVASKHV